MRKLPHPLITVAEALKACIPHIADPEKADRLNKIEAALSAAEEYYKAQGLAATLYTIQPTDAVISLVSMLEMKSLYEGTFSRENTAARDIYDKLKLSSLICPLCGAQQVKTLDHYLAKTKHPQFSITPINLVPSCSDCNKTKSNFQASSVDNQSFHPYFDDIDDDRWLFGQLIETSPAALLFFVSPPLGWDQVKAKRVTTNFRTLGLSTLFAALSSDDLTSMRYRVQRIYGSTKAAGVSDYLAEERDYRLLERKNSWQIAMYDALSSSHWYCTGGFRS